MRVSVGPLLLGAALMLTGPAWGQPAPADPAPDPQAPADAEHKTSPEALPAASDDSAADDIAPDKGRLLVTAKDFDGAAIDATVQIDTKNLGDLEDGEMTFANIPVGRHIVALSARGHRKLEQEVIIRAGEQIRLDVQLIAATPLSKAAWKWTLASSAIVIGAAGIYGAYSHDRMLANRDAVVVIEDENAVQEGIPFDFTLVEPSDCGKSAAMLSREKHAIVINHDRFDRMCSWQTKKRLYGYGLAGVGVAGVLLALYMLTFGGEPNEVDPGHRKGKNPDIELAPRLTADGGNVSLSITW